MIRPEVPMRAELDRFLASGWYRIGPTLMTCRCLVFSGVLRSSLWTRLPLKGYTFRKGLRKLMSRNGRRFRITSGPFRIDAEREALYQKYRTIVQGERSPTLRDFLFGDTTSKGAFDTRELAIWDGDRLVAFSWFDEGLVALQSLIGVYDPAMKRHSLGFYSMLLEIEYGIQTRKKYHYSGYVLPGDPSMDYKLRVGELQFLDQDQRSWRPWSDVAAYALPTTRLQDALDTVADALKKYDMQSVVRAYPWFDAGVYNPALARCIDQPLILEARPFMAQPLIITWDLETAEYRLCRCVRAVAIIPGDDEEDSCGRRPDLLVVTEHIDAADSADEIAQAMTVAAGRPLFVTR